MEEKVEVVVDTVEGLWKGLLRRKIGEYYRRRSELKIHHCMTGAAARWHVNTQRDSQNVHQFPICGCDRCAI